MSSVICVNLDQSKILSFGKDLRLFVPKGHIKYEKVQISDQTATCPESHNCFPNKPCFFTCLQCKSFENTVGKEKLLIRSNFSSSNSVFYPYRELSANFIKCEIVVCKLFQFGRV